MLGSKVIKTKQFIDKKCIFANQTSNSRQTYTPDPQYRQFRPNFQKVTRNVTLSFVVKVCIIVKKMLKLTVYFKLAYSFEEDYWLNFYLVLSLNLKQAPTRCRDRDCNEMSAMYSPAWCSPPENKFQIQKVHGGRGRSFEISSFEKHSYEISGSFFSNLSPNLT